MGRMLPWTWGVYGGVYGQVFYLTGRRDGAVHNHSLQCHFTYTALGTVPLHHWSSEQRVAASLSITLHHSLSVPGLSDDGLTPTPSTSYVYDWYLELLWLLETALRRREGL